jgi:hypothetical protein
MQLRVSITSPDCGTLMDCYSTATRLLVVSRRFADFLVQEVPEHTQLLAAASTRGEWLVWNVLGIVDVGTLRRMVVPKTEIARCTMELEFPCLHGGMRIAEHSMEDEEPPTVFRVRLSDGRIHPATLTTHAFVERVLAHGFVGPGFQSLSDDRVVISPGRDDAGEAAT